MSRPVKALRRREFVTALRGANTGTSSDAATDALAKGRVDDTEAESSEFAGFVHSGSAAAARAVPADDGASVSDTEHVLELVNHLSIRHSKFEKDVEALKIADVDVTTLVKLLFDRLWKIEAELDQLTSSGGSTTVTSEGPKAIETLLDAIQSGINEFKTRYESRVAKLENDVVMAELGCGPCGDEHQSRNVSVAVVMKQYHDLQRQNEVESLRKEMKSCRGHHDDLKGGMMKLAVKQEEYEKSKKDGIYPGQRALNEVKELKMLLAMFYDGQLSKQALVRMLNEDEV
ncbi:hypothetical protein QBC41DRAFT_383801 [Cercophora samala]|uniref:Uncharacterized protein n=1 Tax=Cercophora samala TaxID=330535 RepID=A0AA39YX48_9PEZI|nr:hypothetical protein QBC41DRAFT_383801 [Cercophora samala]